MRTERQRVQADYALKVTGTITHETPTASKTVAR